MSGVHPEAVFWEKNLGNFHGSRPTIGASEGTKLLYLACLDRPTGTYSGRAGLYDSEREHGIRRNAAASLPRQALLYPGFDMLDECDVGLCSVRDEGLPCAATPVTTDT
jgi:hypothetical protein